MKKSILLTAAAVSAIAFAGQATAHTLTFRGATATAIDSTETNQATGPGNAVTADQDQAKYGRSLVGLYLIAQEALGSSLGQGTLALSSALTTGATLPSGNNFFDISLSANATFGRAVTTADLVGANCSAVLSSGGQAGDRTVRFLVSNTGGGSGCTGFQTVNVPVLPGAAGGTVSVTTNYTTEAGTPIDGGPVTLDAIFAIDAFQPAFNATFSSANTGPGAGADTVALLTPNASGMPYTTLGGDDDLGRLAVYVDTRANRSLNAEATNARVVVGDVTNATVTVTGDFSAFDGAAGSAGNPTLTGGTGGGAAGTVIVSDVSGTTATFGGAGGTATSQATAGVITRTLASKPNGAVFEVVPDGGMIPNSAYNANIAFTLTAANFVSQPNGAGAFESIEREGTSFIAPWTGGSQAGSQSVIRLSNTGAATGAVTVVLTNAVAQGGGAGTADRSCTLGPVPADGDFVIGQPQLTQCFGAFLRGDLLITVEGSPTGLTAKMRNTTPSGQVFETSLGRYSGSVFNDAATNPTTPQFSFPQ